MRNWFVIIACSISLLCCSEKRISIPEDVIQQDKMTAILSELHLAQASLSRTNVADSSIYSMKDYSDAILKRNNVKREDFLHSLKFYSDNPELLKAVYDSVITGYNKIEAGLEN